jgi:glyoxylase-like metal-dependent hydrolase (beta-lactamase superfamily II)
MYQRFSTFRPEEWYSIEGCGDNIWRIREVHIDESYGCNMWLIKGRNGHILFDTGFGFVSLRSFLGEEVTQRLVTVSSHSHCDHIGCNHEFEVLYAHPAEADTLAEPSAEATLYAQYACSEMFSVPIEPTDIQNHNILSAVPTKFLVDGDVIDLGDRAFEVIQVPGHSPGSIMLYDRRSRVVLGGDAVHNGPHGIGRYVWYNSNQDDYVKSCERILNLPVDTCHAGHFASFDGSIYRNILKEFLARCPGT